MAKKHSRRRNGFKIPLAPMAGIAWGVSSGWGGGSVLAAVMRGDVNDAIKQFSTGMGFNSYENKFDLVNARILQGLILGGLMSKFLGKYVNSMFRGLPFKL